MLPGGRPRLATVRARHKPVPLIAARIPLAERVALDDGRRDEQDGACRAPRFGAFERQDDRGAFAPGRQGIAGHLIQNERGRATRGELRGAFRAGQGHAPARGRRAVEHRGRAPQAAVSLAVEQAGERLARQQRFESLSRKLDGCRPRGRGHNQDRLPELQPRAGRRSARRGRPCRAVPVATRDTATPRRRRGPAVIWSERSAQAEYASPGCGACVDGRRVSAIAPSLRCFSR